MAVKGIFFDAAGVLYTRREPTRAFVSRLLEARGLPTELSAQDRLQQQALRARAKRGQVTPGDYWDGVLRLHGIPSPAERQALAGRIDQNSDQVLPIPGARQALAALKQRGFVLGVITDTIYPLERKQRWLGALGISAFLDVLACSTDLGLYKPEPAIYLHAVQQANLTPGESAFVGHAVDELEGARRAGLATVAVLYEQGALADHYAGSLLDLLNVPIFRPHP